MKLFTTPRQMVNNIRETLNIKAGLIKESVMEAEAEKLMTERDAPVGDIAHQAASKGAERTSYSFQRSGSAYVFKFNFMAKPYEMKITQHESNAGIYDATFYVRGNKNGKPLFKYGIGNVSNIEPTFKALMKMLKVFLTNRRPTQVRFVPADGVAFPSQFYTYTYDAIKELDAELDKTYNIIRGTDKEGALFIIKRGDQMSQLKTKGWRPSTGNVANADKEAGVPKAANEAVKPKE